MAAPNKNLVVFEREKLSLRGAKHVWDEWTEGSGEDALTLAQFSAQMTGGLGIKESHIPLGWRVVCSLAGGSPHKTDSCNFAQFSEWFGLPKEQRYSWFDHTESRQEEIKQVENLFDLLAEGETDLDGDAYDSLQEVVGMAMTEMSEPLKRLNPATTGRNMTLADLISLFTFEDEEKARRDAEDKAAAQKAEDGDNALRIKGFFKDLDRGDTTWAEGELLVKKDPVAKTGSIAFFVDGKQTWYKHFKNMYNEPHVEGYPEEYVTGIGSGGLYAFKPFPTTDDHNSGADFSYSLDDRDGGTTSKRAAFMGLTKASSAGGELYGFMQPVMFG